MGIELLPKVGNGVSPTSFIHHIADSYVDFTFQNEVLECVVGLWGFQLTHPNNGSATVQELSLEIDASVSGNVVTAKISASLSDGHGHELDTANSWVIPVCLALTGSPDPTATLQSLSGLIPNGQSAPVQLGGGPPYAVAQSVLGGFSLAYATNQRVLGMSAGCNLTYNQAQGSIGATASIHDGGDHVAASAGVFAGCLELEKSQGLQVFPINGVQSISPYSVNIGGATVSQVAVMITNWTVVFPNGDDHWITGIGAAPFLAGIPKVSIANGAVTLPSFFASMWDNENNGADNTQSHMSGLLLAL